MSDERLTPTEVQLVLRRAAELERRRDDDDDGGLAPAELEELARDAGLSLPAVRQALAEVRAGAPPSPGAGGRALVVTRTLPGSADELQRRLERLLHAQMMRKKRDFGMVAMGQCLAQMLDANQRDDVERIRRQILNTLSDTNVWTV